MKRFYVYIYCDTRKPFNYCSDDLHLDFEPFYVGKGSGYRFRHHMSKASLNKRCPKSSIIKAVLNATGAEPHIEIIKCKSEEASFDLETSLINVFGRRFVDNGLLTNMCGGGEVACNPAGTYNHSEETKAKLRGPRKSLQKENHPMWGKKHSAETVNLMSEKAMARGKDSHFLNKMSGSNRTVWIKNNLCGSNNPFFGKRLSDAHRDVLSKVDRSGVKNPFHGKHHSKETKNKMRISVIESNVLRLKESGLNLTSDNFNAFKSRNCPRFENIDKNLIRRLI